MKKWNTEKQKTKRKKNAQKTQRKRKESKREKNQWKEKKRKMKGNLANFKRFTRKKYQFGFQIFNVDFIFSRSKKTPSFRRHKSEIILLFMAFNSWYRKQRFSTIWK